MVAMVADMEVDMVAMAAMAADMEDMAAMVEDMVDTEEDMEAMVVATEDMVVDMVMVVKGNLSYASLVQYRHLHFLLYSDHFIKTY